MLVYSRIKELAALKGVTLTSVAQATGVSVNTMKNWDKVEPSVYGLLDVAQYFDVSVDYLIGYSDNPFSHKKTDIISNDLIEKLKDLSTTTIGVQKLIGGFLGNNNPIEKVSDQIKNDPTCPKID